MKNKLLAIMAVGLLAGPMAANADLIDFNSEPNGTCPNSTSIGGLDFVISNPFLCTWEGGSGAAENGTIHMIVSATSLTMSLTGGGSFNLNSFDSGISWYDAASTRALSAAAYLGGGGTSIYTFDVDRSFQTFASNLNGLDSITFNLVAGGSYIAFDNIEFTRVPEPGTLALLGLGLLGLGFTRRRKTA